MKKLRFFDSLKFMLATVACMFAIMPAHAATLPAGYTELEYLQTDGNSWIDTGIKGDMSYKYEIDFQQLDAGQYRNWGAFDQPGYNGGPNMSLTYLSGFAVRWTVSGNSSQVVNGLSPLDSNRHHIIIDNGYITWDGVNKGRSTGHQDNYVFGYNLFLGTVNPGGITPTSNAKSKYYSYKVWNTSGELIQDLIPAKNSSGVVGMYDLADSNPETAFHTNAGTGEFIAGEYQIKIATTHYNETKFAPVETRLDAAVAAVDTVVTQTMSQAQAIDQIATNKQTRPDEGCTAKYCLLVEDEDGTPHWYPIAGANGVAHNLPAGYTELQYIESTGTQYIDTGIKITSNDIIETEFKNASSTVSGALYGVYDVSNGNNSSAFYANGTYYAYGAANVVVNTDVAIDTNWHNVIHNFVDGTLKLDNTTVEFAPFSFTNNVNSYLFARYYNGTYGYYFSGYIKRHKITRNGAVIIDLIPARRNNDNVVGMYDLADSNPETAFHTNAGTGDFTAGPDM